MTDDVIETERLVLPPPDETHRRAFVALFQDADFMVFTRAGALGPEGATARFERMVRTAAELPWAKRPIVERASGAVVGYLGLDHLSIDNVAQVEIGYRLVPTARGQGYATEAGRALLDRVDGDGRRELVAIIDPTNGPSARTIARLGFGWWKRATVHALGFDVYRRVRPSP